MSSPHFKLAAGVDAPSWAKETLWERRPVDAREYKTAHPRDSVYISTHVYLPIGGHYQFKFSHAKLEPYYKDWSIDEDGFRWKLECWDNPPEMRRPFAVIREGAPLWESGHLASIVHNNELLLLKAYVGHNHLLIESKFLVPGTPDYVPNKWNLPIKRCQITKKNCGSPLRPEEAKEGSWCEVHEDWVHDGKCRNIVPTEYLPCDIESDQGGDYCETHGVMSKGVFSHICQEYKGPKVWGKHDEYDYEEEWIIPRGYQTCYDSHYRKPGDKCYTHDTVFTDKAVCDKYDGPMNIQPIQAEKTQ